MASSESGDQAAAPVTVVSLVVDTHGGVGHNVAYHESVGRAAAMCGWRHIVLIPHQDGLAQLRPNWRPYLRPGCLNEGLPRLVKHARMIRLCADLRRFAVSLADALRDILCDSTGPVIFFVEDFNGLHLLGIDAALRRLPADRLSIWLLYRQDPTDQGMIGRAYRHVTHKISARRNLTLLTDSEPLADGVRNFMGMPASVMPIPHTAVQDVPPYARNAHELIGWWPGSPRPEKAWRLYVA